jgi:hypothetical protein
MSVTVVTLPVRMALTVTVLNGRGRHRHLIVTAIVIEKRPREAVFTS